MTDLDKILEKHNNRPPSLYKIIHDELGYSHDCTYEIVDAVEEWLPKEQSAAGSQNVDVEFFVDGFNDCLKKIKGNLK